MLAGKKFAVKVILNLFPFVSRLRILATGIHTTA